VGNEDVLQVAWQERTQVELPCDPAERETQHLDLAVGIAHERGVLALLNAVHDLVGPRAIGAALNALAAEDERQRVNHVRSYSFDELEEAPLASAKDRALKKRLGEMFP
jgi:hypothetical protein